MRTPESEQGVFAAARMGNHLFRLLDNGFGLRVMAALYREEIGAYDVLASVPVMDKGDLQSTEDRVLHPILVEALTRSRAEGRTVAIRGAKGRLEAILDPMLR